MKKFTMIAIVICVALMLAVPAMALEVTHNGLLRVRGFAEKGYSLHDDSQSTSSYFDMRLRVNTKFKVSDNVSVDTRFRAFNRTMGETTSSDAVTAVATHTTTAAHGLTTSSVQKTSSFQWERAWMSIKTPIGLFRAGRMIGGAWGLTMFDNEGDEDRIRLDTAIGPIKTGFVYHKLVEGDKGNTYSSGDANRYTVYVLYPSENFTAGWLYSYIDFKNASDASMSGVGLANNFDRLWHVNVPFFKAKFGAFGLQGELLSVTGTQFDWHTSVAGRKDTDKDSLDWNLEGQFNFGAGSAYLGYIYCKGQDNKAQADTTWHKSIGDDWEGLFILAGSTGQTPGNLGGMGNFSNSGNDDGIKLIYGGASFKAGDAISLGVAAGTGKADEAAAGQDDEIGIEVDLKFGWSFYDGSVVYSAVAAYLAAGDYWEGVTPPANTTFNDSMYALYHKIQVNF